MKDVKNKYDSRYSQWTNYCGRKPSLIVRDLAEHLTPHASILDLGAGRGENSIYLAEKGHEVTAVDILKAGLSRLRRYASKHNMSIRTLTGDFTDNNLLRQLDRKYDVIVMTNSLKFLMPEQVDKTLNYFMNLTAPGGHHAVETHLCRTHRKQKDIWKRTGHTYLPPGKLAEIYDKWKIKLYEEGETDWEQHGTGPKHRHQYGRIIAQKG